MERRHAGIRCGAALGRFGADGDMFAVGFIPDRNDVGSEAGGAEARLQLRAGLPGETVSHAKRVFSYRQEIIHRNL